MVAEGAMSKATQLLTSAGVHNAADAGIWEKRKALHPEESAPVRQNWVADSLMEFGDNPEEERQRFRTLHRHILKFPHLLSGGPSGLLPDHVKDCLRWADAGAVADLLAALDGFVCWALHGKMPLAAAHFLCGARLTPLKKRARSGDDANIDVDDLASL